ncbi:beta-1,4 N-acetylgalactosaminyltransferase 1-like [Glandiceps talaboti]
MNIVGDFVYRFNTPRPSQRDIVQGHRQQLIYRTCDCPGKRNYGPLDKDAQNRRAAQLLEWNNTITMKEEPLVVCPAMSPLTFVGGGLTVEPLSGVKLIGLSINKQFWIHMLQATDFEMTLVCIQQYGVLKATDLINQYISIAGNNSSTLKVSVSSGAELFDLNELLRNITYQGTKYDVDIRDLVKIRLLDFDMYINIHLKREHLPRLYGVSVQDHVSKKVTIVTKTFQRPRLLKRLIRSIRTFYPNITIIVADDSKERSDLQSDHYTHYYKMPFAEGWFAGRNLALSQVRTKYFFWVDDDFIFTEKTKLEKFVSKLEAPNSNLDLVAGILDVEYVTGIADVTSWHKIYNRKISESGFCVEEKVDHYGPVDGFPQCHLADAVLNFFMAKTLSVREVGFDPTLERVGHFEFFWDGLGKLRVAICADVSGLHLPSANDEYYQYRYEEDLGISKYEDRVLYSIFKNNMKCVHGMYRQNSVNTSQI